jgi:hypothetical protein
MHRCPRTVHAEGSRWGHREGPFAVTIATAQPDQSAQVALTFCCPKCQRTNRLDIAADEAVCCAGCEWQRAASPNDFVQGQPVRCLVCGCNDLWRQKNLSSRVGLLMVGAAILFSTIAYALWQPVLALGILMGFALVDALLYLFMRDVSVCYRCAARHAGFEPTRTHGTFDLEVAERYRQERLRRQTLSQLSS